MATTDNGNREREIFEAALDIASAEDRLACLQGACGQDAALLARVRALLQAHEAPATFLPEHPKDAPAVSLVIEKAGDRIDRYKLLQQIGEGGCGVVYLAEQVEPIRRRVALKVIKLGMDTRQVIGRFEAERQALALMDHPNVARVLDAGATDTGRPFFVMELVEGKKITDYCDEGHLQTEERLDLFVQVCQAIQHAHQKGIIHRDIKPSNILVAVRDGKPLPKVIDFGIAKATAGQVLTDKTLFTAFEQFMGTPAYMSPEQAEMSPSDVDTRSDIYALGVLLYELLTGVTLFDKDTLAKATWDEVRRIIREREPVRPSTRLHQTRAGQPPTSSNSALRIPHSAIDHDLDWIVMKCLEKDRARRYESASLLALDVGHYLRHEPVLAGPPSALRRTRKFIRRHRTPVLAAVIVFCGLALGLAGALVGLTNASRERNRAQAILRQMDLKHAQDLFETDRAAEGLAHLALLVREKPDDLPVAEWLLNELTQRSFPLPLLEPIRHEDHVLSARFSPDGTRILTVSRNNTARIWDAATGRPLTPPLAHDSRAVPKTEFLYGTHPMFASFSPDGTRVVTGACDNEARIWDANSGRSLTPPLPHPDWVSYVGFSPDGRLVATACKDGAVRLWNAVTGEAVGKPFRHQTWANFVEFSPAGDRILTGSDDRTAQVWDVASGTRVGPPLRHQHELKWGEFSPDGERVVTASEDSSARIWDTRTGQALSPPLKHEAIVCTARFSPDGGRVVTASFDKTARLWDGFTGEPLGQPMRHKAIIRSARFSPEGLRVVTASEDGTARIWDAVTGEPLSEPMIHHGTVWSAEFDRAGQTVLTASDDATARVWDARPGQPLHHSVAASAAFYDAQWSPDGRNILTKEVQRAQLWDATTGRPRPDPGSYSDEMGCLAVGFSPDSRYFLTANNDGARIWLTGSRHTRTRPLRHEKWVHYAEFSADGRCVATASADGIARVWSAATGQPLGPPLKHRDAVFMARFSPSGREVLTASADGSAQLWDARTGQALRPALLHPDQVTRACFSPDGRFAATVCKDMAARVWDLKAAAVVSSVRHLSPVNSAVFSPDGRWLLTASDDNTARVWDARTGQPVSQPLTHNGHVLGAEFRADGQRVLTASDDGTARLWDARTGQCISEPFHHANRVSTAHFYPDGTQVLTASSDHTVRVWETVRLSQPAPQWLPALAECVAGQRLNAQRNLEPVPPAGWFQWRRRLTESPVEDDYGRWARWFCADRSSRTTSPSSTNTTQQFVAQLQEATRSWSCEMEDLRKVFALGCTSAQLHLLWLRRWQPAQPVPSRREIAELEWHSRKEFFRPEDAARAQAVYWARRGDAEQMAAYLADAQRSLDPSDYRAWEEWAELLFSAGRVEEGLQGLAKAAAEAERASDADFLKEVKWRLQTRLRWHRDRPGGQLEWLKANAVLPRPADAPPQLIDLSSFYTGALGRWLPDDFYGAGLRDLPQGVHQLGGTSFDIRALIQLNSANDRTPGQKFPNQCSGIPINQSCHRLHFLQAADAEAHTDEKLGAYRIHYVDGQAHELPIIYGQDVLSWQSDFGDADPPVPKPVWQTNRPPGITLRLFQTTWTNPRPEAQIKSLDFVSAEARSGPFLVALTAEP